MVFPGETVARAAMRTERPLEVRLKRSAFLAEYFNWAIKTS
jgi:hypothetical protein